MAVQTSQITTASGPLSIAPNGGSAVNITGAATSSESTTSSSGGQTLVTKNYLDGFTSKFPDWGDGNGTNFDNRYVKKAGDTMTGALNVGSNKITLKTDGDITTTFRVTTPTIISPSGNLSMTPAGGTVAITGAATSSVSTTNNSGAQTLVTKNYLDTFTSKFPNWNDGAGTNFDGRYVKVAGDTMTGTLNIGSNKIVLKHDTGNITTSGDVSAANFRIDLLPPLP